MTKRLAMLLAVLMLMAAVSATADAGLPAYTYTGSDSIEGAIANALASDGRAEQFLKEPGCVTIPCPIIHQAEMTDDTHAKVYGTCWILNYVLRGEILESISGGEIPAVILLEMVDGERRVISMEEADIGEDYYLDIHRFAHGDEALEDKYYAAGDLDAPENREIRTRLIRDYVEANRLAVTAYRDYGWDPVALR